ncbi:hypothetical protein Ancab_001340 [Ancistrocladus abbreviatus]
MVHETEDRPGCCSRVTIPSSGTGLPAQNKNPDVRKGSSKYKQQYLRPFQMKKKKTKPFNAAALSATAGATTAAFSSSSMKGLIHDHSLFFDKLIELIPAKFYLPSNADDKVWFQGLSKQEKVQAKQKSIENTKKSRRDRLDPEKLSKTTLDLLKERIENENSKAQAMDVDADELSGVDGAATANFANLEGDERSVTYEELRERLRNKIEELRAGRGGGSGGVGKKDNERREKRGGKKRKRNEESSKKLEENNEFGRKEKERDIAKEVSEAAKGIVFGKVKLGDDEGRDRKTKKKRKLSKEKELERALKLEQEGKKDPEKAKKHAWKVVADRAMGKKVHDNTKLLKQSIRKEERKHKKSVEKWKERTKTTEMRKQEKQEKRKENIKSKIEQKKRRKIEKREKKLMRPGFEGRKDGFINGA